MTDKQGPAVQPLNPVRRITLIVVAIGIVLFFYGMISDRFTPHTSQAIVQAYLVRIAPEVAGKVIDVPVDTDQRIDAGAVLFRLDPLPYTLAVRRADAQLAAAGQSIGANTAGVASAEANLAEAVAKDPITRKVHTSYMDFKAKYDAWAGYSEAVYHSRIRG